MKCPILSLETIAIKVRVISASPTERNETIVRDRQSDLAAALAAATKVLVSRKSKLRFSGDLPLKSWLT